MGRKPNSAKLQEKEEKEEISNQVSSYGAKNKSCIKTAVAHPRLINLQMETTPSPSKNMARKTNFEVRRSERLQNGIVLPRNRDIERVIQEITISESEKEKEDSMPEEMPVPDQPSGNDKNVDAKLDHLTRLVEAQTKGIDALASKASKNIFTCESSSVGDVTYRSLYIESQKKVEALKEENNLLSQKLENALGKVEVYEKWMTMFSSLSTEATKNISSEAIHDTLATMNESGRQSKYPSKRKRIDK